MHQSSESSLTGTDSVSAGSFLQAAAPLRPQYSAKNVQFDFKKNIQLLKLLYNFTFSCSIPMTPTITTICSTPKSQQAPSSLWNFLGALAKS